MITALLARVAWARVAKIALPGLLVALIISLGWLAWSTYDRTRVERDVAVADVLEMRRTITDATVPPAADGTRPLLSVPDAKAALAGVVRDRDDARGSLSRIDRETKAAKGRADLADAALVREQAANLKRLGAAQDRIAELAAARPSADAAANAVAIEDDSKAAWESWR